MAANYLYEPITYTFSTPATVWNIPHGLNRGVAVELFDTAGNRILAEVTETDLDNLSVSFYSKGTAFAVAGKAVLI